jgi:hypothetical protein
MRLGSFLFDRTISPLCFRYMVLSDCEIHIHVQVNLSHHTAKFSVAVSGSIVMLEDLMEYTVVFGVLLGVHWYQASELDSWVNCGKHTAFIHIHGVHAQINIMVLCDYFLWDLNEIASHWFGLAPRLLNLTCLVQISFQIC